MANNYKRLRELDFLRGMAILLVLLRHQQLLGWTTNMGWIGVDLFFVLSGFLVSGLLFREYSKFGNIKPKLFLIRRGFKIYPIYYLFYWLYLTPILIKGKFETFGFLSDMVFIQNYACGWGWAFAHSWSLAVEEHFYFGFALAVFFAIRSGSAAFATQETNEKLTGFEKTILLIFAMCLALRIFSNVYFPEETGRNFTMTHLRIDSLLAGVLVSYWYHFRKGKLQQFMAKYRKILLLLSLALVSFTPLLNPNGSFFVNTIGFTFLFAAFAIVLAWFITDNRINERLDKVFSAPVVNAVSKVGFASYSIYIIHVFSNYVIGLVLQRSGIVLPVPVLFIVTTLSSVFCGLLMTHYVEKFFLTERDRHFPARTV